MFYWFYFEDGYRVCTRGMSANELKQTERAHGQLVYKGMA